MTRYLLLILLTALPLTSQDNGALDYFSHIRDGGHDWHENDRANHDEGYTTDLIAKAAVKVIATHDPAKPLFPYVPFNAPHTPLQAPDLEALRARAVAPNISPNRQPAGFEVPKVWGEKRAG